MIGITISPQIPLNIFPFECLSADYLRIHLRPLGSAEAGEEDSACLTRTAALQKPTDRPVQLIKSVVIFQQAAPPAQPPTPGDVLRCN